ncbi:Metallo-dependent phosphatase [Periconia macrospinosa]|uniref:Metallo-dependent phosphatase n=1 Tax=Periconia macrospinosa TaxID=97972 RepID=A0A2V1E2Z8_9PLEO|nr:Metallo-dependent phosphatase [Periconia macrospinosa]
MFGSSSGLDVLLQRRRASKWEEFIKEPRIFLASQLYKWRRIVPFEPIKPITVVCISDTHNSQPVDIPAGEILIHAGDITQGGTWKEIQASIDWLKSLPHPNKVVIAGNHDILLDPNQRHFDGAASASIIWGDIRYLESESTVIICANGRHLKIYGSPLTPRYGNWVFQYLRHRNVWYSKIPEDTDILITHGPPKGHLDAGHLGCKHLLDELWRTKPRLHVFGHVHDGHGTEWIQFDGLQRAYENVVEAGGGQLGLARAVYELLVSYLTPMKESRALLVNASIVGGLQDKLSRRPVVVRV